MRIETPLWLLIVISLALLFGFDTPGFAQARPETKSAGAVPSAKEIVRLLLSLRDIPLRVHESCAAAGTGTSDVDLGDFVSGWLTELKSGTGANWIEASAKPENLKGDPQPGWKCVVMFRHVNGDDRWGWGVSFSVRASRQPLQNSIRCLGAG